jgi:hypothetical protein
MVEIVTERLVLRPLLIEVCQAIIDGDPGTRSWVDGYPTEGDVVVASIALEAGSDYDATTPWGPFQICLNNAQATAIGGVGAIHAPDPDGSVELGYGIAESMRGSGFASEAVAGFIATLPALGVRTVVAVIAPGNEASQRLAAATGFSFVDMIDAGEDGIAQRWELKLDE